VSWSLNVHIQPLILATHQILYVDEGRGIVSKVERHDFAAIAGQYFSVPDGFFESSSQKSEFIIDNRTHTGCTGYLTQSRTLFRQKKQKIISHDPALP
jgi:hypothetical protein